MKSELNDSWESEVRRDQKNARPHPQERENVAARWKYLPIPVAVTQCLQSSKTALDDFNFPSGGNPMRCWLKPFALVDDVGLDKILVGFGEINNALDEADQRHGVKADAAGNKSAHN